MKFLFSLLLTAAATLAIAQTTETDKFIEQMRKQYNVMDMNVTGGTIKVFAEQVDERLGDIAERVTNVHFFAASEAPEGMDKDLDRFVKRLDKRGFDLLTQIRSEGTEVFVYLREENNVIQELIAVGHDDNDYFFGAATGNFRFSDLENVRIIAEDLDGNGK